MVAHLSVQQLVPWPVLIWDVMLLSDIGHRSLTAAQKSRRLLGSRGGLQVDQLEKHLHLLIEQGQSISSVVLLQSKADLIL